MSVKYVRVECPACGAPVEFTDGQMNNFCAYCGSRIRLEDEGNESYDYEEDIDDAYDYEDAMDDEYDYEDAMDDEYDYEDEASKINAETDRIIKLKKLELQEKWLASREKMKKYIICATVALGLIALISFGTDTETGAWIGLFSIGAMIAIWALYKKRDDEDTDYFVYGIEKRIIPSAVFESKDSYQAAEAILRRAGFTNIITEPVYDVIFGIINKTYKIESIVVDGEQLTPGNKKYSLDVPIVIRYHAQRLI